MFAYGAKYNESESDIQNNDLLYKLKQNCQNTFENLEMFSKRSQIYKNVNFYFIIYIDGIIRILYF